MKTHGKKFRAAAEKRGNPETRYPPRQAIDLVKSTAFAKFDETVEVAVRLGVDPKHADQAVRGTVVLGGTPLATIPQCPSGKTRSLEDFVPSAMATTLKNAGGTALVATGRTSEDGTFKIERLGADKWTLGYQPQTIVNDAGNKLVFTATVTPADATVAGDQKVTGVKYTITAVTCAAP